VKFKDVYYLPSGRIFLLETEDNFVIECTEMRDVSVDGKEHFEVRNSLDPKVIWKHLKPYNDKWLLTVSTQKGCPHKCEFCDVAPLGFHGNLSQIEILEQIEFILESTPYVKHTSKAKIGFARMGEPAHNIDNVIGAMKSLYCFNKNIKWLPCFNSILPRRTLLNESGFDVIDKIIDLKENYFNGFLHFQLSINSTNEEQRKELFGGAEIISIEEIINYINKKDIHNRTITLNFIVMEDIELDIDKLVKFGLNKNKFVVKLIPLNNTERGIINNLKTFANYENYDDLILIGNKFKKAGIPVVVDSIAKCEEAGLCCGQLVQNLK